MSTIPCSTTTTSPPTSRSGSTTPSASRNVTGIGPSTRACARPWAMPTTWARCRPSVSTASRCRRCCACPRYLLVYPFRERLYPQALEAIAHVKTFGPAVILSDGDIVFQPRKIQRSGLWDAVEGRVLVYLQKEPTLERVRGLHPAVHYVMIDDSPQLLSSMKQQCGAASHHGLRAPGAACGAMAGSRPDPGAGHQHRMRRRPARAARPSSCPVRRRAWSTRIANAAARWPTIPDGVMPERRRDARCRGRIRSGPTMTRGRPPTAPRCGVVQNG